MLLRVGRSGQGNLVVQTFKPLLLALLYGQVLVLAVVARRGSAAGRFFVLVPLRYFGKYSYGFYVFHPFAIYVARWYYLVLGLEAAGVPVFAGSLIKLAAVFGLSMVGVHLSWVCFENPFLKWKEAFAYATPPAGAQLQHERVGSWVARKQARRWPDLRPRSPRSRVLRWGTSVKLENTPGSRR